MKETLKKLREELYPLYGKGESEAIIRIIFHHLKGWSLTDILIRQEEELSPYIKEEIDKILARLLKYEPVQYITGEARFHGMDMRIKPGVLIPRPETDELVDIIVNENKDREDLEILDLCTGSGCIAIALSRSLKFPKTDALDNSPVAIEVAEENAKKLFAKIKFIQENIFEWQPTNKYDIIVSNPPYVGKDEAKLMEPNVLKYEPADAIFTPEGEPLIFYKRIAEIAEVSLKGNGKLYLEINPLHVEELKAFLSRRGFIDIEAIRDSFGKTRFITAKKT